MKCIIYLLQASKCHFKLITLKKNLYGSTSELYRIRSGITDEKLGFKVEREKKLTENLVSFTHPMRMKKENPFRNA